MPRNSVQVSVVIAFFICPQKMPVLRLPDANQSRLAPLTIRRTMGRKLSIVALGVVCLALISAGGVKMLSCTPVDATNKATSDLALTIYNQNFAVVRQPVALNFESGLSHMRFSDITAHVEPDSVILRDPSGENKLQILEQNYR